MTDIVEMLRRGLEEHEMLAMGHRLFEDAANEIKRLRAALIQIEYLDSPQVRGLSRRKSFRDIARAALGWEKSRGPGVSMNDILERIKDHLEIEEASDRWLASDELLEEVAQEIERLRRDRDGEDHAG